MEKQINELLNEAKELKEKYLSSTDFEEKLRIFKSYNKVIAKLLEIEGE